MAVFVSAVSRSRRQLRIKENCLNYGMPFANSRACTLIAMLRSSFLRVRNGEATERGLSRIYVHVLYAFSRGTWPLPVCAAVSTTDIKSSMYIMYTYSHVYVTRIIWSVCRVWSQRIKSSQFDLSGIFKLKSIVSRISNRPQNFERRWTLCSECVWHSRRKLYRIVAWHTLVPSNFCIFLGIRRNAIR